ncbi:MAG: 50S ribosomal protein L10 [Candidatus Paceibacterota bacterium]|jgi:large subunit ribosomal protein L10
MALKRNQKEEILKELDNSIKDSESVVFVDFHGINVGDETILRRDLREKEIGYKVSRKTLLKRVLEGKAEGELPPLTGEVALVYSKDATKTAREVYNFHKAHNGILKILGGIFEGKFIDSQKMTEIAMIPSREILYAQFVNLINSPIQRFAVVLDQIAKSK